VDSRLFPDTPHRNAGARLYRGCSLPREPDLLAEGKVGIDIAWLREQLDLAKRPR